MGKMTDEQQAVVQHAIGSHARVLAVAGSGKTTTMVLRIKRLVTELKANPQTVLVLMFNKMARDQFNEKLERFNIPTNRRPAVHTFHSFAYSLISRMMSQGLLPKTTAMWTGDKEELFRITVHTAIRDLAQRGEIGQLEDEQPSFEIETRDSGEPRIKVDPGEAIQAISLWKGSLIPPERAGYHGNEDLAKVYMEFEKLRTQQDALTFDDYVPYAINILESGALRNAFAGQYDHLIVDEYQDINYGQQRLIELLAGKRADVMVVGDDDQTIYEWRGARPSYMIREFRTIFDNKPHVDYNLSHSFRFGPIVAQSAQNVISFNTTRVPKSLVAHDIKQDTDIQVFLDTFEQPTDVYKALADQVETLKNEQAVPSKEIIVLARMFAQLSSLEMEFSIRRIPYRVEGHKPFFERREIVALLDYIRVATALDKPPTSKSEELVLSILNVPSRKLRRETMKVAIAMARMQKAPLIQAFIDLQERPEAGLSRNQRKTISALSELLQQLRGLVDQANPGSAHDLLRWLVNEVEYTKHFENYYGGGEESAERKLAVDALLAYAQRTRHTPLEFLAHIDHLDSTQGAPAEQLICMTTIFRTKGLEYDYVFMPACEEGFMPCLIGSGVPIYDKSGLVAEPEPSEAIENERRLFYVGLTRAKRCVYIGASERQTAGGTSRRPLRSRFLEEIQLDTVTKIMMPIQRLHQQDGSQDSSGEQALLESLHQYGGVGWVKRNLTPQYLTRLQPPNEMLTGRASLLISGAPDKPFAYRQAYPTGKAEAPSKQEPAEEDLPF